MSTLLQNNVIRFSGLGDITGLDSDTIDPKRMNHLKRLASQYFGERVLKESN